MDVSSAPARSRTASRHRKPASAVPMWRSRASRVAALAASALLVFAWPTATRWIPGAPSLAWVNEADALGARMAAVLGVKIGQQPEMVSAGIAVGPGYRNPLRDVGGLVPERIDMGVDFNGSGPVYALGNAVITNATGTNFGWPGGGWITYQLTNGPDAGLMVFVAEDITPAVQVGQHVTSSTVIGTMYHGGDGIETGWAQQSGLSAESQLAEAGGIGGGGPFPTRVGVNFEELLRSLGVPAAPNSGQAAFGILPERYPAPGAVA
jgi:hypothetical protein